MFLVKILKYNEKINALFNMKKTKSISAPKLEPHLKRKQ